MLRMDNVDKIRGKLIKVLEALEDACEQATEAQLPDLPNETRLQAIRALNRLIDTAKSNCDEAESSMLQYIRLQSD
jgi:16S rRNA U1498 N3-methylase RsmE